MFLILTMEEDAAPQDNLTISQLSLKCPPCNANDHSRTCTEGPGAGEQVTCLLWPSLQTYFRLPLLAWNKQVPAANPKTAKGGLMPTPQPLGGTPQNAATVPHPRQWSLFLSPVLKGEAVARPVLKALSLPSYGLDPQPTPKQQGKGRRWGAVAWHGRRRGKRGGQKAVPWGTSPTSLPEGLADGKDPGVHLGAGGGGEECN